MEQSISCPAWSDQTFGPRIDPACREFDFTLLFEDVVFSAVPVAVFLVLAIARIFQLWSRPRKCFALTYKSSSKLAVLVFLLIVQTLAAIFRNQDPALHTSAAQPGGTLVAIFVLASVPLSYLEHRHSPRPPDLLVLAYTLLALLSVPHFRTLWLTPVAAVHRVLGTLMLILSSAVVVLESWSKDDKLGLVSKTVTAEQTAAFWSRGFFTWLVPVLRMGYSNVFRLSDLPKVDRELTEASARSKLDMAWKASSPASHQLLLATAKAYRWPIIAAIIPRLVLLAFTFCLPFLIEVSVEHLNDTTELGRRYFGPSIVGAFILTYLGVAVCRLPLKHISTSWRDTDGKACRSRGPCTGTQRIACSQECGLA